ncbi:MAG: molybdopterin oxidoreductase membrane subunit, partial [Puniceicoccaceae bacterium 5H]
MPRREIIENHRDYSWITQKICGIVEGNAPKWWWIGFIMACFMASFTLAGLIYLVSTGTGVWGLRSPVFWGWAIVNFVFWIGIGHAGTLISAILCLLKQGNRNIWLICQVHRGSILLHTGRTDCLKGFPLA